MNNRANLSQNSDKNAPVVMDEGGATLKMKWIAKSNKTKGGQF